MFAIRRKYCPGASYYSVLLIAHFAVLGLQFHYKYYQFSCLPNTPEVHFSALAAKSIVQGFSGPGWEREPRLLLDKRFSPEYLIFLAFPFFTFPLTVDATRQVSPDRGAYVRSAWSSLFLRGPPEYILAWSTQNWSLIFSILTTVTGWIVVTSLVSLKKMSSDYGR